MDFFGAILGDYWVFRPTFVASVLDSKPSDGAIGAHTQRVKITEEDFRKLANKVLDALEFPG